jgi:hypothetical protein
LASSCGIDSYGSNHILFSVFLRNLKPVRGVFNALRRSVALLSCEIHRDGKKMKRSLKVVLFSVLFTFVIAVVLTFSLVRLLHSRSVGSIELAALLRGIVSASPTAPPVMVGTEHPVPVTPTPALTTSKKHGLPKPVTTPAPEVAENDSRREVESPSESVREKAEQGREKAEQMRARVEDLYQKHLISKEAYKTGQAEYQREIGKYERQIANYHSDDRDRSE